MLRLLLRRRLLVRLGLALLVVGLFAGVAYSMPSSDKDESKVPHYFGPNPNWANSPFTLPDVAVKITPAAPVSPVTVGNALSARQYATDNTVGGAGSNTPGQGTVLVVIPTALPAGTLQNFQTYTQNDATFGSPGNTFNAYVLRPTANPGEYTIVYDSGQLTVPVEADGIHTWTVAGSPAVQANDVIAFYGQGIPLDLSGTDVVAYPAPTAPTGTFVVGGAGFPLIASRTYSFAATILPPGGSGTGSGATAEATVGANGAVTDLTITNPGSGYTADALVTITKADGTPASDPASAMATYDPTGVVTGVAVDTIGHGYTTPTVLFTGGGAPTEVATATAFGGVDGLDITNLASVDGYHLPTVSFDYPDDPNGTIARGKVICTKMSTDPEPICVDPDPTTGTLGVVTITGIEITDPGSGYSSAPGVAILDGTQFEPAPKQPLDPDLVPAEVASTISVDSVRVDTFGSGYTSVPGVAISNPTSPTTEALATATTTVGAITGFTGLVPGSGYITAGGIKKFQDDLPGLCDPTGVNAPVCSTDGTKEIPLAVSTEETISAQVADTYEIGLVQYRTSFSSSLPDTLVRGYVQIETTATAGISQHYPLTNANLDPNLPETPVLINGEQVYGVTAPQFLGPSIVAGRDKAVRIVFRNLLPTGEGGDLFMPTDTTLMGSGMGPLADQTPVADLGSVLDGVRNPMCTEGYMGGMPNECFTQNRATLHLHGGVTPWISDGTPHQWITPKDEITGYPQGVSVEDVPDMDVCEADDPNTPVDESAIDGCQTFYYTNQQSARLMFYHDHAWGITRLNVYAGEAAPYLVTDDAEQGLITGTGALASLDDPATPTANEALGIPLVIQDRTFVPQDSQLYNVDGLGNVQGSTAYDPVKNGVASYGQDPTWDASRWGGYGNLWYHHVYMPAQNPGDPSGMSAFGRWMYGPWFWPPASPLHPPIDNPYYDPTCDLNDPNTWQYDTDPFCEPKLIPSTPNISVGMEQFNDTPIVNGVAYPKVTLDPKSYRFRILNAANDRFWNLQWYVADATGTEVALDPALLAAAQTDPVVFPTPVHNPSTDGPDWIQIGNEGGFLPAPVVVNGQQETTWITDPTRFDVGNVDLHSLLLAPAERADVVVDFSRFPAGTKLILYNDAPAAFPARVPSYDYYTGAPDLRPVGAPSILPGYGPNTRTIMQVTISGAGAAPAFNLSALNAAFRHHSDLSGVFESSQDPIIVGQAAYNSAYGTNFVGAGWCNDPTLDPASAAAKRCDGYARIQEGNKPTDLFGFNSLRGTFAPGVGKVQIPFQPKGLHDEMNSTAFDEFGRMQANLGLEAPNANPLLQNIILYPYVNPSTELVDATNLPRNDVVYNTDGTVASDVKITPIARADDGTQIWKMTHNGVDTHPIHWHLWNVQVLNRVSWDNIILPPDPAELGWKETVRVSPLQDTIVALRPIIPEVPFELPNSARPLHPAMPLGSTLGFNNVDANGNPTTPIVNSIVNFGWEYVYHCHILSHEEMDMMRPMSVLLPPNAPVLLTATYVGTGPQAQRGVTLTWNDTSINETQFVVERRVDGGAWVARGTPLLQPLEQHLPSGHGTRTFFDQGTLSSNSTYAYRVVAQNVVGYGNGFMQQTVQSISTNIIGEPTGVAALTSVAPGADGPGNQRSLVLNWTYAPSGDQTGFTIQRANNPAFSNPVTTIQVNSPTTLTYTNTGLSRNTTYYYRVRAKNAFGWSAWSSTVSATTNQ